MATKALRGLGGLPKEKSVLEVSLGTNSRKLPNSTKSTMERSGLPLYSQESWLVTKRVLGWCG